MSTPEKVGETYEAYLASRHSIPEFRAWMADIDNEELHKAFLATQKDDPLYMAYIDAWDGLHMAQGDES